MLSKATCAALFALLVPAAAAAKPAIRVGARAPNFELRDMQRSLWELSSKNRGRIVVVDFFRTDCKPCRKSLAGLRRLHRTLRGKPVEIVLVALLEQKQGEGKLRRFLAQHELPFRVLIDSYGVAAGKYIRVGRSYRLPALFVIDAAGRVRVVHRRPLSDPAKLARRIGALLEGVRTR